MARKPRRKESPSTDLVRALSQWLSPKTRPRQRLFHRIRISGPAREFLNGLPQPDQHAFAELLLKLDANPIAHARLIVPNRGLYAATFRGAATHTVLFEFNFAESGLIRIADIH